VTGAPGRRVPARRGPNGIVGACSGPPPTAAPRPAVAMADQGAGDRHVVLVGLMGTGKSTVGRRLAKELARPFADVDEQVELRAGRVIPRLFEEQGEEAFRRLEAEVLAELLDRPEPLVVAAGGGAVTRAENRARLTGGRSVVVWLQASPAFLAARTDPTHRPLLAGGDPAGALERLLAERRPLYERVADIAVDVEPFHQGDEKPKRALARHIAALVTGTAVTSS
jgi:shikimate kinase